MSTPTIHESFTQMDRPGWSVGARRLWTTAGALRMVDGSNGEHLIIVRAPSQAEAWGLVSGQAEALRLLGER